MNLPEKTRLFLPLLLLLWVCSFVPAYSQNWQEYQVLNQGNYLSFQRTIFSNPFILQQPDPSVGSITLTQNGSLLTITFNPVMGAEGTAEFIIEYWQWPPAPKIEAFRVQVSTSFVTAKKDFVTVEENSAGNILDVLANDEQFGGDLMTITHIAAQKNGIATISSDGASLIFSPKADFSGTANVTYVVCDELGSCDKADVSICVTPQGPLPQNDTIFLSTNSRTPVVAFMPVEGFTVSEGPSHGQLNNVTPDTWRYTPNVVFDGLDEFVLVKDDMTRHVIVDVYYKASPNTFVNSDRIFTRINEPVTFNVLANDVKQYPISAYTTPDKGTLVHDTLGYFTYNPETGYEGAVSFSYTTCFLSQCETGLVIIYIGDMIPENAETYHLTTMQDVPLVLNYQIPLDGYAFAVNADPSEGNLELLSGWHDISVLCDSISGYDLLIYTPSPGFNGNDYFEVMYCIDGGACHLVKVDVKVDESLPMACPCVDHCVWPGDADGSGKVEMNDVLSIGWQLGYTGTARNYANNSAWMAQNCDDWAGTLWGTNSKYADSDGDGVITEADFDAVSEFYMRAHTLIPEVTGLKADYTFDLIPLTPHVDSGDLAVILISIGSQSEPIVDMHGLAFSLNLPVDLIDTNTVELEFYNNSWLAYDAANTELVKQPNGGRIDAAFTRMSGKPASGIGVVAKLSFIVEDDIDGIKAPDGKKPVEVDVRAASSMASNGLLYDVPGNGAVIYLNQNARYDGVPLDDQVFVFPNPSTGDALNVHVNGDRSLKQIEILSLSGTLVASYDHLSTKYYSPDIAYLHEGLYFLRITTTDGVVTKKVEVLR